MMIYTLHLFVTNAQANEFQYAVAMSKLIVHKERYLNKRIRVSGYYIGSHYPYLYLSKDHAEIRDLMSGIAVIDHEIGPHALSVSPCQKQYIVISGEFRKGEHGGYGLYNVNKATTAQSVVYCWETPKD